MPELPEVQTITSDLKKYIVGAKIRKIDIIDNYKAEPTNEIFTSSLTGQVIKDVKRIAKNIIIELENGNNIGIHLAMTGQVLIRKPGTPDESFERVRLTIDLNDKEYQVRFCDMRMFGHIQYLEANQIPLLKKKYGPDAVNDELSPKLFLMLLKGKRSNIKNVLLDQTIIAGIGNIYATDALFLSGINPNTNTKDLTVEQADTLQKNIKLVLNEGIKNRGSTLGDKMYIDAFGKHGKHQNFFKIYGKSVCPTCGSKTVFQKLNGRGTYYCPICQPFTLIK